MLNKQKGQSTLEYAMIVAVVVAGLFAMQIYMRRGVEGKLRSSTNDIGAQFEAGKSYVHTESSRIGTTVEETAAGVTTSLSNGINGSVADSTTTSGNENVTKFK